MARWQTTADASEATAGGSKGGFEPAPRGIYTIQVANHKDTMTAKGGKNPSRPMVILECEIADEGPEFGKKVWYNIIQIPKGEKGHGFMVHALHAFGMPHDGDLDFDTDDFQGQQARALLGVTTYEKKGDDGRVYVNKKNFVEELYTEAHPEPTDGTLPPPREDKQAAKAPQGSSAAGANAKEALAAGGVRERFGKAKNGNDEDAPF